MIPIDLTEAYESRSREKFPEKNDCKKELAKEEDFTTALAASSVSQRSILIITQRRLASANEQNHLAVVFYSSPETIIRRLSEDWSRLAGEVQLKHPVDVQLTSSHIVVVPLAIRRGSWCFGGSAQPVASLQCQSSVSKANQKHFCETFPARR